MGMVLQGHSSSQPQASTRGMMRGTAATHTNPTPNLHPNLNHSEVGGGGREVTGQDRLQSHPSMSSQLPARSQRPEPALWTSCPLGCRTPPTWQDQASLQTLLNPRIHGGHGPAPSPMLTPRGARRDTGDPLPPAPLSHPWDGAVLGAKGPHPPQDYEICLGGGGSSSGVPKPARCPGRLPAPARPTPATGRNTQKAPVYCSPGGAGGPQRNGGAGAQQEHPPTKHHFGSPGPKLSRAAFSQLSYPSKPGFGELSICCPPGRAPAGWGARGLGERHGVSGGQGKHRGATGGQGALPAAAALPHKGLGDGRLRTGSISAAEVSPPPPSPATAGGHKPRPEPTRAGAGVTAMRGRVRGTPPHPGAGAKPNKEPPKPQPGGGSGRGEANGAGPQGPPAPPEVTAAGGTGG